MVAESSLPLQQHLRSLGVASVRPSTCHQQSDGKATRWEPELERVVDEVFDSQAAPEDLYASCAWGWLECCLTEGVSGALLVGGAVGSAHTATLGCEQPAQLDAYGPHAGLLARAVRHMYDNLGGGANITVCCLEEVEVTPGKRQLLDLLAPPKPSTRTTPSMTGSDRSCSVAASVKSDAAGTADVALNLGSEPTLPTLVVVVSPDQALAVLQSAVQRRVRWARKRCRARQHQLDQGQSPDQTHRATKSANVGTANAQQPRRDQLSLHMGHLIVQFSWTHHAPCSKWGLTDRVCRSRGGGGGFGSTSSRFPANGSSSSPRGNDQRQRQAQQWPVTVSLVELMPGDLAPMERKKGYNALQGDLPAFPPSVLSRLIETSKQPHHSTIQVLSGSRSGKTRRISSAGLPSSQDADLDDVLLCTEDSICLPQLPQLPATPPEKKSDPPLLTLLHDSFDAVVLLACLSGNKARDVPVLQQLKQLSRSRQLLPGPLPTLAPTKDLTIQVNTYPEPLLPPALSPRPGKPPVVPLTPRSSSAVSKSQNASQRTGSFIPAAATGNAWPGRSKSAAGMHSSKNSDGPSQNHGRRVSSNGGALSPSPAGNPPPKPPKFSEGSEAKRTATTTNTTGQRSRSCLPGLYEPMQQGTPPHVRNGTSHASGRPPLPPGSTPPQQLQSRPRPSSVGPQRVQTYKDSTTDSAASTSDNESQSALERRRLKRQSSRGESPLVGPARVRLQNMYSELLAEFEDFMNRERPSRTSRRSQRTSETGYNQLPVQNSPTSVPNASTSTRAPTPVRTTSGSLKLASPLNLHTHFAQDIEQYIDDSSTLSPSGMPQNGLGKSLALLSQHPATMPPGSSGLSLALGASSRLQPIAEAPRRPPAGQQSTNPTHSSTRAAAGVQGTANTRQTRINSAPVPNAEQPQMSSAFKLGLTSPSRHRNGQVAMPPSTNGGSFGGSARLQTEIRVAAPKPSQSNTTARVKPWQMGRSPPAPHQAGREIYSPQHPHARSISAPPKSQSPPSMKSSAAKWFQKTPSFIRRVFGMDSNDTHPDGAKKNVKTSQDSKRGLESKLSCPAVPSSEGSVSSHPLRASGQSSAIPKLKKQATFTSGIVASIRSAMSLGNGRSSPQHATRSTSNPRYAVNQSGSVADSGNRPANTVRTSFAQLTSEDEFLPGLPALPVSLTSSTRGPNGAADLPVSLQSLVQLASSSNSGPSTQGNSNSMSGRLPKVGQAVSGRLGPSLVGLNKSRTSNSGAQAAPTSLQHAQRASQVHNSMNGASSSKPKSSGGGPPGALLTTLPAWARMLCQSDESPLPERPGQQPRKQNHRAEGRCSTSLHVSSPRPLSQASSNTAARRIPLVLAQDSSSYRNDPGAAMVNGWMRLDANNRSSRDQGVQLLQKTQRVQGQYDQLIRSSNSGFEHSNPAAAVAQTARQAAARRSAATSAAAAASRLAARRHAAHVNPVRQSQTLDMRMDQSSSTNQPPPSPAVATQDDARGPVWPYTVSNGNSEQATQNDTSNVNSVILHDPSANLAALPAAGIESVQMSEPMTSIFSLSAQPVADIADCHVQQLLTNDNSKHVYMPDSDHVLMSSVAEPLVDTAKAAGATVPHVDADDNDLCRMSSTASLSDMLTARIPEPVRCQSPSLPSSPVS